MRKQIDGDPSSEAAEKIKTARELEGKDISITDPPSTVEVVLEVIEELEEPHVKEEPVKEKPKKKLINKIFSRKKDKKKNFLKPKRKGDRYV